MKTKHIELSQEFKEKYDAALTASRSGDFVGVLSICSSLAEEVPDCKPVQILIGEALWQTGRMNEAILFLRQATQAHPQSELLSLLLFQVLFQLDKTEEAKYEISRFLSIRASSEYDGIINDCGWNREQFPIKD